MIQSNKVVAAILTAHDPSRWHYRQIARAQFLPNSPIPYKFVFGDAPYGDWSKTGIPDDEILHAPGSDLKTHLHLKDKAACQWALEQDAQFLWRAMDDTWWWPERILKANLFQFDYGGNFPCTLRLGGVFKTPMAYYDFCHGGCGIWLSKKAMQKIVDTEWRADYLDDWPNQLEIGFGLTAPKLDYPWDDFFIGEALKGNLAWDDPLRRSPVEAYSAQGITLYSDDLLFFNDDPSRCLSIHDPGRSKQAEGSRFAGLQRQIRHRNIAAAMAAARVPAEEIPRV
jgi:hypothetical protein